MTYLNVLIIHRVTVGYEWTDRLEGVRLSTVAAPQPAARGLRVTLKNQPRRAARVSWAAGRWRSIMVAKSDVDSRRGSVWLQSRDGGTGMKPKG